MSRVYLGLVERGEELGLGQARLPEQSLLPCLMLLASATYGEFRVVLRQSPDVPGVGCAIGAPAEPIEPVEWRSDVLSIPISFKKVK